MNDISKEKGNVMRLNSLLHYLSHTFEILHFSLRINRTKYYFLLLFWVSVMFLGGCLLNSYVYLSVVFMASSMFYLGLLGKRRLNDMNISGLWILLTFLFIWFVGSLVHPDMIKVGETIGNYFMKFLFIIGIFPGSKKTNKYGEVPQPASKIN